MNERKHQQQEDDKTKKHLALNNKGAIKILDKDSNSNMPNQYARVQNTMRREKDVQGDSDQTFSFVDEFLEETVRSSSIYESGQEVEDEIWTAEHNIHASISVNNTLHNKCMNLLFLPEKYHISILDGVVDTCVLGKGWEVLSIHNSRRANVVCFDHEAAIKRNLPIASAITVLDLPNGSSILLLVHECIYNETSNHSLLSDFQLREFEIIIDSTCHRHGGTQQMVIQGDSESLKVSLELERCMIHFKHRIPTSEEVGSLKQYCLTQGETPWNPSSFSDQVADRFYQLVIAHENILQI